MLVGFSKIFDHKVAFDLFYEKRCQAPQSNSEICVLKKFPKNDTFSARKKMKRKAQFNSHSIAQINMVC